jgi:hypothetical protein
MTYYNPEQTNIHERIQQGFLSDTREGRKQRFFAWYNAHKDYESFDGHEAQKREQDAGITANDWREYHASFKAEF